MNDFNCNGGTCIEDIELIFQSINSGDSRKLCRNIVELYPESITRIQGDLAIGAASRGRSFSVDITDLSRFSRLEEVTGNLVVDTVRTLRDLEQLNRLRTIGGDFVIGEGAEPTPSEGTGLERVGNFPALTTVGKSFVVSENSEMTTLGSFPELRSIGGRFLVGNNSALASLGHFPKLQSIGGGMLVASNRQLASLGRFPTLTFLGRFPMTGESFVVSANSRLTSLGAFPALRTIEGDFRVGRRGMSQGNRLLESVDSFPVLGSVQGDFIVFENAEGRFPPLADFILGDFSMLRNIEGQFQVERNSTLTSLNDFSGLERIGGNIRVFANGTLTNCCGVPKSVLAAVQARGGVIDFRRNVSNTCEGTHLNLEFITNALCSRLSASADQVLFPSASNTGSITIEASRGLRISTEADWVSRLRVRYNADRRVPPPTTRSGPGALSLSREEGGRGTLFITVDPNGATTDRSSTLTLTAAGVDDLIIPIYQRGTVDLIPTFGGTTVAARSYTQGEVVMLTLPEATSGNAPLVYTLTPEEDLPAGLSFDSAGRRISGAPTEAMGTTRYTYTVTDANNSSAMLTVDLTVTGRSEPTFSGQTVPDQFYSERSEFINTLFLPSAVGGSGELTYILTPPLPEGLDFSGDLRIITGTNAAIGVSDRITPTDRTEYIYTVTDAGGMETSLNFDITVLALSLELNADSRFDQRDAQALYYAYLPGLNETTQEALFGRLGVAGGDAVAELRARAGFWSDPGLHSGPITPDLNQDGRIDQRDARILYYTYRFGELLESSEDLRNALLGGLSSNPSEARRNANMLINSPP